MTQVDLANPTLEFLESDPDIAARFGTSDSISYIMHNIADFLGVSENLITMPLMFLFKSVIGMYGIVWATPTAEVGSLVVAGVLIMLMVRDVRKNR